MRSMLKMQTTLIGLGDGVREKQIDSLLAALLFKSIR